MPAQLARPPIHPLLTLTRARIGTKQERFIRQSAMDFRGQGRADSAERPMRHAYLLMRTV